MSLRGCGVAQLGQLIAGQDGGTGQRRCRPNAFASLGQLDSFFGGQLTQMAHVGQEPSFGVWVVNSPLPTCSHSGFGVKISRESDPAVWETGRIHQLADGFENSNNDFVMSIEFSLQLAELHGEVLVGGYGFSKSHECAHHVNASLHRSRAVQNHRGHDCAVFRECMRPEARVPMLLGTSRILRPVQRFHFGFRKPKEKVPWEPIEVVLDLFVEALRGDAVQSSEVDVEQNPPSTHNADPMADVLLRDRCGFGLGHLRSVAGRYRKPLSRKVMRSHTNAANVRSAAAGRRLKELPDDRNGSIPACQRVR